jgi:hypothetical protein
MQGRFVYPIQICNPSRLEQRFTIHSRQAPLEHAAPFLKRRGKDPSKNVNDEKEQGLKHGLVKEARPDLIGIEHGKHVLEGIRLAPFACTGCILIGVLERGEALIHVTQEVEGKIVGGLSVLVISRKEHAHERRA